VECPIRVFQEPQNGTNDDNEGWIVNAVVAIIGAQDQGVNICGRRKVPVFYSGGPDIDWLSGADALAVLASIVFGAIHCIAWSFHFATTIEALLWRSSAVSIIAIPVLLACAGPLVFHELGNFPGMRRGGLAQKAVAFSPLPLILLYITARLITVVLAFINLSSLPPGAFETVHWTTLIPHL
jgi:hypothetical protein